MMPSRSTSLGASPLRPRQVPATKQQRVAPAVTFQQEKTKRWQKYYFPSLPSLFNGERCQAGRAAAPGAQVSSGRPLCRQLSPGWLISRMARERLNSEHQLRGSREQPATPAKLICSPNAMSPSSSSRPDFHPNSQAFHSSWKKSGKSVDCVRPTPVKREISREQQFPEGWDEAQQLQSKPVGKAPSSNQIPTHGASTCPPLPPWLITPKKAAGSTQHSKSYKSFSREKLCFCKPGGCNAMPPSPRFILLWHRHRPPSQLPGKGPGSMAGGCSMAGGSAALPPRLLLPLAKYLFNEGIPVARTYVGSGAAGSAAACSILEREKTSGDGYEPLTAPTPGLARG